MPDATITSSESTFGTISGTFAADQSTIAGTVSGYITGTLSGSIGVPGPQGPQGPQGEEGPPGPPGPGSTWGTITGTLSAQTDLQTALNSKYSTSNPDGFITSAALTGYLTKAGNLSGLADINVARENINLGTNAEAEFYSVFMNNGTAHAQLEADNGLQVWDTSTSETVIVASSGITFPDLTVQTTAYPGPAGATTWGTIAGTLSNQTDLQTALNGKYSTSNPSGFITSSALTPYLTSATAATTYQTLSGMSSYLTTASAALTYAPIAAGQPAAGTVGQVLTKNSGTNYDSSWQTLIPGDRYLTSSTTSLTIDNANKTLTIGTGLSYSSQQDIVITYDAANHMHARVLTYNSSTGVMDVDVLSHSGSGTYAAWTVNVGGAPALASVVWGDITGTLGDQSDLATALNAKLEITTAASTYQTLAGMSSYLTTSAAASTYYPLTGNPSGFLTSAALSGYATETYVNGQGFITSSALTPYLTSATAASTYQTLAGMSSYLTTSAAASTYLSKSGGTMNNNASIAFPVGGIYTVSNNLSNKGVLIRDASNVPIARFYDTEVLIPPVGITFSDASVQTSAGISAATAASSYYPLTGNPSSFLVAADISGLAPLASPSLTGNVTITSDTSGAALFIEQSGAGNILTLHDQASDTTFVAIDQNGKVNTIPSTTANAGFNVPHGTAPTSPVNGDVWTTTSGLFMRQNGVSQQYMSLGETQTISGTKTFSASTLTFGNSTAAGTINIGTGATVSASTKAVNIGTSGASGSTTNVIIGSSVAGAGCNVTVNGVFTTTGGTQTINNGTGSTTTNIATGATTTGLTKAVNIGTAGVAGSTTNITIGSTTGTSTTTLQGTTNGVTQSAGDSSLKLATTAFVTAAVPALATSAQSRAITSTTTALSPYQGAWQRMSPDFIDIQRGGMTASNTGTVTYQNGSITTRASLGASSTHKLRTFGTSQVDQSYTMTTRERSISYTNFNKIWWTSGRTSLGPSTTAGTTVYFSSGKAEADANGDLVRAGFGWNATFGTSPQYLVLQVHNGTTLTNVTSTYAIPADAGGDFPFFDWDIIKEANGTTTLYVNGTSVATTALGPTGASYASVSVWREEVSCGAGASCNFVNSRSKFATINF